MRTSFLCVCARVGRYFEAAGVRVVPVNYDSTPAELDSLFAQLNGFMFPGGGAAYPPSAQYAPR